MTSEGSVTWAELLTEAEGRFARAGLESAAIDARRIVEEISGHGGAALVLARAEAVTVGGMQAFDRMVGRRAAGEPLQYVLGHWSFRTLDLLVDGRVLIPRPETEVLVEVALAHVDRIAAERSETGDDAPVVVVDLGTGSGAVALSIAGERVGTSVIATDRSPDALAVARANLSGLGRAAARVRVAEGSWFEALDGDLRGAVDVVVSNPPYIRSEDALPEEVEAWEPPSALRSGPDGLDDLRPIIAGAAEWLRPGGALAVELDPRQASTAVELCVAAGLADARTHLDLVGRDRFVSAIRP